MRTPLFDKWWRRTLGRQCWSWRSNRCVEEACRRTYLLGIKHAKEQP